MKAWRGVVEGAGGPHLHTFIYGRREGEPGGPDQNMVVMKFTDRLSKDR